MFNLLESSNQVPVFFAKAAAQVIVGVVLLHYGFILFKKKEHSQKHVRKISAEIERGKNALQDVFEGMPDMTYALIGIPASTEADPLSGFYACDKQLRNGLLGRFIESLNVSEEMKRQSAYWQTIWAIKNPALEEIIRKLASEKVGYIGKLVWYFNKLIKSEEKMPALSEEWGKLKKEETKIIQKWKGLFELLNEADHQDVERKVFAERLKNYYREFDLPWDADWGRGL